MFDGFMQPFRQAQPIVEHGAGVLPALIFIGLVGALVLFIGWAQ